MSERARTDCKSTDARPGRVLSSALYCLPLDHMRASRVSSSHGCAARAERARTAALHCNPAKRQVAWRFLLGRQYAPRAARPRRAMAAPGQQLGSTRMLASRVAGGGAALRGTRVWLEGVVVARGSSRQATLDDGTGLVQLEPADKSTGFEKATPGAYVAVVGGVKRTTPFACVAQKVRARRW